MYALLIVIHVIASTVLILVILLQAGRGGGLSESFGVSSTQTFFGTSTAKVLQRATAVCAATFLLTCLGLTAMSTSKSRSLMERQRIKEAVTSMPEAAKSEAVKPETVVPAESKPDVPTPQTETAEPGE